MRNLLIHSEVKITGIKRPGSFTRIIFLQCLTLIILLMGTLKSQATCMQEEGVIPNESNNPFKPTDPAAWQNDHQFDPQNFTFWRKDASLPLPCQIKNSFTTSLYTIKRSPLLPDLFAAMEYEERTNIMGLGITASLRLPLFQEKKWSLYLNGNVSSSYYHVEPHQQRNRWNFEHQIGGNATYYFSQIFHFSLGFYHYRIINDVQFENPEKAYIKSNGGIMTFRVQY